METKLETEEITIEIDQDIVEFFESAYIDYQSRINAVLRHFVNEQKRQEKE